MLSDCSFSLEGDFWRSKIVSPRMVSRFFKDLWSRTFWRMAILNFKRTTCKSYFPATDTSKIKNKHPLSYNCYVYLLLLLRAGIQLGFYPLFCSWTPSPLTDKLLISQAYLLHLCTFCTTCRLLLDIANISIYTWKAVKVLPFPESESGSEMIQELWLADQGSVQYTVQWWGEKFCVLYPSRCHSATEDYKIWWNIY